MRTNIKTQLPLFCQWTDHKLSEELQKISEILDRHPEFVDWVHFDLSKNREATGDIGMSSDQVLRATIIKHIRGLSYEQLGFNIVDSTSTRAFMRLEFGEKYGRSCLQDNISRISEATWELINVSLVLDAKESGFEDGKAIRIDSTVTTTDIHYPTDSSLLYDCTRVIHREFLKARKIADKQFWRLISNQQVKEVKRLNYKINNANNDDERLPHYKKLLKLANGVAKNLPTMIERIEKGLSKKKWLLKPLEQLKNVQVCLNKVIYQTTKRVINGQTVPSFKKIVSIFEPHSDIIVKDRRETQFGHKIFVSSGKSNMILSCDIPRGNPNDSEMFLSTLESIKTSYGIVPRKTSADGGFASRENVKKAKVMGIKDVCFPKKCRMKVTDMVKSVWVFKNLLNWRAGIEGLISFLKRCFGLGRATWKGFEGFKACVRSGIASYNLVVLARLELK